MFTDGLKELGHVDGKNVVIEYRWAEGRPERFAEMAADLVRNKVDVIVASSQGPALAAKRATTTIPIVMVNAADPVEAGLVASLARPGGNVTGLSQQLTPEIRAKQLQLLKETLPRLARVAVLHSPATTVGLREYEAAGQSPRATVPVRRGEAAATTSGARSRRWSGIASTPWWCRATRSCSRSGRASPSWHASTGCPGIYSLREFTELGGLMSYSARITEQFRRAAVYVDKILRGASPATLPVESPTSTSWSSTSRPRRRLGSPSHRRCWSARTS